MHVIVNLYNASLLINAARADDHGLGCSQEAKKTTECTETKGITTESAYKQKQSYRLEIKVKQH